MSGSLQLPDASIPLQAAPSVPPPNPFAQLGQMVETQNALLQNQQNQIVLQQRQAMGAAYANAKIDPTTGLPDMGDVVSSLQNSGPSGAMMIPTVVQGNQAAQLQNYQLNSAGLKQTQERLAPLYGGMNAIAGDPAASPAKVYSMVNGLAGTGLPSQTWLPILQTMPQQDPATASDPQASAAYTASLQNWARSVASRGWDSGTQATEFTPRTQTANIGGQTVTFDANPVTNPGATSMSLTNTLDPATATAPTPIGVTHSGAPITGTRQQFVNAAGAGGGTGYNFGSGRITLPPSLIGPGGSPNGAGGQPPADTPAGGVVTGLSPAAETGQKGWADASVGQLNAATGDLPASVNRVNAYQQALQALQNTTIGPGTDRTHLVNSTILAQSPELANLLSIDPTQVAAYDEANKYLSKAASSNASAAGAGTDMQLAQTLSGNPSVHMNQLAATDVIKANIGLETMGQQLVRDFQNGVDPTTGQSSGQQPGPETFANYKAQWYSHVDPRAYLVPNLSQAQFSNTVSGMSPSELARFQATLNHGVVSGAIAMPAWAQPPAPPAAQSMQGAPNAGN